jgi:hypothetical protein
MTIEIKLVFRNRIAHLVLYLAYNNFIEKYHDFQEKDQQKVAWIKVRQFISIGVRHYSKNWCCKVVPTTEFESR